MFYSLCCICLQYMAQNLLKIDPYIFFQRYHIVNFVRESCSDILLLIVLLFTIFTIFSACYSCPELDSYLQNLQKSSSAGPYNNKLKFSLCSTTLKSKPCYIIQHKHGGFIILVPMRDFSTGYYH